jgi:hypothetical protein
MLSNLSYTPTNTPHAIIDLAGNHESANRVTISNNSATDRYFSLNGGTTWVPVRAFTQRAFTPWIDGHGGIINKVLIDRDQASDDTGIDVDTV